MYKVSVITPCSGRPGMFNRIRGIWESQDYPHPEWIVVEDEAMFIFDGYSDIEHQSSNLASLTIGAKRNEAVRNAHGDIIIHMDDDDIYRPDWISKSVAALIESKANIVGLSTGYFHNVQTGNVHLYTAPKGQLYLMGATLCYWRKTWERKPFKDIQKGEDTDFISNNGRLHCHGYKEGFMATIHGANTCSHQALPLMKKLPPEEAASIINHFYASPTG